MIEIEDSSNLYPKRLKDIPQKPKKLYIEGNIELLDSVGMAVIGSRHHSEYGKKMCKVFTKELVQYGVTIISGLAEGIDSIAHKTCLENGGKTIAVLPSGFDNIFPKQNEKLFKEIVNLGGSIVSEYNPKEKAEYSKFLKRNRIVAGLGIGTLVVEAGVRSGTSVTARITKEQGKKVFSIPSSLENRQGITTNEIIQKGGKLVTCVDDIFQEFQDIEFVKKENVNLNHLVDKEYMDVYSLLSDKPQHINLIAKKLKSRIEDVSYKLMMLELDEHIIQLPGKYFIKR